MDEVNSETPWPEKTLDQIIDDIKSVLVDVPPPTEVPVLVFRPSSMNMKAGAILALAQKLLPHYTAAVDEAGDVIATFNESELFKIREISVGYESSAKPPKPYNPNSAEARRARGQDRHRARKRNR